MQGYDPANAQAWILSRLEKKPFQSIQTRLSSMIEDFIQYDLHFMRITGVLNDDDFAGDNEYDEDEAFEFIYDAYLSDHPGEEDSDMIAAALLNSYMTLQAEYLEACGLCD